MTDTTELAQREKFEAWFKSSFHPDKTGPYIKDQLYFAWKAASAELVEALEKAQAINAAAEKLVRCKGRYHSELNYRALAALFGVTTPDLPPLDSESSTVTVKLPPKIERDYVDGWFSYKGGLVGGGAAEWYNKALDDVGSELTAAGIKWEAE